jgi:hypothetical protein
MLYCIYRMADGQFLRVWPNTPPYDPAIEGVAIFQPHERPDLRLHRYDAAAPDKLRLATVSELQAYDAARTDAQAASRVDEDKAMRAIVLWVAQKVGVAPAVARQEILAIYRSL